MILLKNILDCPYFTNGKTSKIHSSNKPKAIEFMGDQQGSSGLGFLAFLNSLHPKNSRAAHTPGRQAL